MTSARWEGEGTLRDGGMAMSAFPRLAQVVLDTIDARRLAEFYGFHCRPR